MDTYKYKTKLSYKYFDNYIIYSYLNMSNYIYSRYIQINEYI